MCSTDAEAGAVVTAHRAAGSPLPVVGLLGGDLWRTLGAPPGGEERLRSGDALRFDVDVVAARLDGRSRWFVAHLVARRSWWWGRVVGAFSAEFLGDWDVVPRSHPGDGRVEVLDVSMPTAQRWAARARLRTGSHLPHPGITVRSAREWSGSFHRPVGVWLDGQAAGRAAPRRAPRWRRQHSPWSSER